MARCHASRAYEVSQGVATLYTNIKANGYELLYLTSRAIGQANITRGYIQGVRQGEHTLPDVRKQQRPLLH